MKKVFLSGILILGLVSLNNAQEIMMESKIDSLLSLMSLEEKVAMCHGHSMFSSPGVERLGIPELNMLDGPHGIRPELNRHNWEHAGWTTDSVTAFPALSCLAASFNPELAYEYGIALGEEARSRKKDVLLGPGVNIYRTPLGGRNFEYMGEDPFLTSEMVVPYIEGLQKNGVSSCVKHFAVNNQEEWRAHINVEVSDRALHEIYLPAFKAAVTRGNAWSIMGAYNQFRGQHCCHNEILLNKILKEDWGFDGVVISDWGGTHNTNEAIHNGLDIEMGSSGGYNDFFLADAFLELLQNGEVKESILDEKVRRILRLMLRTSLSKDRSVGSVNTSEHQKTAFDVAVEGIVLLKNDDELFPLDPNKKMTIAVIGENAIRSMTVGGGSSEIKAKYEISVLDGIRNRFTNAEVIFAPGYKIDLPASNKKSPSLAKEAIEIASNADVVLFIGGLNKDIYQDCEGHDRTQYGLPYGQEKLIKRISKVNKNVGVILISGNAVAMPWLNRSKSVIQAWYLGSEAGHAVAAVVSGDMNPSGKLPISFPVKLKDNSAHHYGTISYPGDGVRQEYKDGILVGYRWHDTKMIRPLFAFGHGLSYTSFQLTNIKSDQLEYGIDEAITIACNVQNTGNKSGAEVIQVYIGKPDSKVERAIKELKGFKKSFIESGATSQVEISINVNDLAYYDEGLSDWKIEKGVYRIYVGNASDHITTELEISIK